MLRMSFFQIVLAVVLSSSAYSESARMLSVDRVVASVDGEPITVSDLKKDPRSKLATGSFDSANPVLQQELERAIFERLISAEATKRKITVEDGDIERYLQEVQRRNGMSAAEFETALRREGLTLAKYRSQLQGEILRSKLASSVAAEGLAVSDQEVDAYIELHPEYESGSEKVKIRQLSVDTEKHSAEESEAKIRAMIAELESGKPIEEIAELHSENRYAPDGGLIGILTVKEMSPEIQSVIEGLDPKQPSAIVRSPDGYHFFYIDSRFGEEDEAALREEVRALLRQSRQYAYVDEFFKKRLLELHSVERLLSVEEGQ